VTVENAEGLQMAPAMQCLIEDDLFEPVKELPDISDFSNCPELAPWSGQFNCPRSPFGPLEKE
jgi:hypothetical protein